MKTYNYKHRTLIFYSCVLLALGICLGIQFYNVPSSLYLLALACLTYMVVDTAIYGKELLDLLKKRKKSKYNKDVAKIELL